MQNKKGARAAPISPFPNRKVVELYELIKDDIGKFNKSKSRNDWSKIEKKAVTFIHDNFPEARGDNTEMYIKMMQYMAWMSDGKPLPDRFAKIIRMIKPETIVRIRRGIVASTLAQREKEEQMKHAAVRGEFDREDDEE